MSELRVDPSAWSVPPGLVALAAGLGIAALTAGCLLHPAIGLHATEAVGLVTALLAAGATAFLLVARLPTQGPTGRWVALAALVGIAAALLSVLFDTMVTGGDGLRGLGDPLARTAVLHSHDLQSVLLRCGGLAVLAVGCRRGRTRLGAWAAGGGALVVTASFVLSGHARSEGPAAFVLACAFAHVLAVTVWFGGLAGLALALHGAKGSDPGAGRLMAGFARLMTGVIALLLAAGTGLAVLYLPGPGALVHSAYGQVLLVKVALVLAVLVVSAANHVRLVPAARDGDRRALHVLRMNIAVEQIGLVAVLLVTEILMRQDPAGLS